jgi:hypothetical protein
MGRCGHDALCYIQSLPNGLDHSSNGLADGIGPLLLSPAIAMGR